MKACTFLNTYSLGLTFFDTKLEKTQGAGEALVPSERQPSAAPSAQARQLPGAAWSRPAKSRRLHRRLAPRVPARGWKEPSGTAALPGTVCWGIPEVGSPL